MRHSAPWSRRNCSLLLRDVGGKSSFRGNSSRDLVFSERERREL